jgi:murein DD-endopeptidase MepM/ murein hydrolase activator NlpD
MPPLARAAVIAALLSALLRAAELPGGSGQAEAAAAARATGSNGSLLSLCPAGTLPDGNVCIPVPRAAKGGPELESQAGSHREKSGRLQSYEHIPRRPDRPADYRRYLLPVEPLPLQAFISSGYDLDLPDALQRRGDKLHAVGHGGIDIAQKRGTEVRLVALEHQVGDAEVVFVGVLFGNSVVTRHSVREGGRLREYLAIHGHLAGPAPGLRPGTNLRQGSLLGFVGDSGSPGDVHLHLELRRLRDGVDAGTLGPGQHADNSKTLACDPRNVLPLKN